MTAIDLAQEGDAPRPARWVAAFALVAAVHAAGGAALLATGETVPPSVEAPEAAILIDLPPDLALPQAESVESVAAPAVPDLAAEEVLPDAVETVTPVVSAEAPAADPVEPETTAPLRPAELMPVEPAEVGPVAPAETAPTELAAIDPVETDKPSDVAEVAPVETVEAAEVPPLPVARPERPRRIEKPTPAKAAVAKAAAPKAVRPPPPPSDSAVAGHKASGAGRPDPEALAGYSATVRARIMRERRNLDRSLRSGAVVTVGFTVRADGGVTGIALQRSSGDPRLDEAALAMVARASPLPPIPSEVGRASVSMVLPVRFTR